MFGAFVLSLLAGLAVAVGSGSVLLAFVAWLVVGSLWIWLVANVD